MEIVWWIVLGLFALLLIKILKMAWIPFANTELNKLPGPKTTSWLQGNSTELLAEPALAPHQRWFKQLGYPKLFRYYWALNGERLCVCDPELIKIVLKTDEANFSKRLFSYNFLRRIIGDGLVTQLGDKHKLHRRLINPSFNVPVLKNLVPMFVEETNKLVDIWKKIAEKEKPEDRKIVINKVISKLTLNIIGKGAFGFDFEALTGEKGTIGKRASKAFNLILNPQRSLLTILPFYHLLPTPGNMKVRNASQIVDSVVLQLIQTKRANLAKRSSENPDEEFEPQDLLDSLIGFSDEETGTQFTDSDLAAHVKTFLMAGHETTATLVLWTFHALSTRPQIVSRLKKEIYEVLGDRNIENNNDIDRLEYLNMVIKETFRLFPPVPIIIRRMEKETELEGRVFPAGTTTIVSPLLMHKHPDLWEDPEEFNPDRWSGGFQPKFGSYLPFLVGDRNCIGQRFAMMEAKVIVATLLQSFTLTADQAQYDTITPTLTVTMRPRQNVIVSLSLDPASAHLDA